MYFNALGVENQNQKIIYALSKIQGGTGVEDQNQKIIYALFKIREGTGEVAIHWTNSTRILLQ
jgi:hypothetical protein